MLTIEMNSNCIIININKIKNQQGNRGDMRKIHVTRQFSEASSRHGDLIKKKNKKPVFR